MHSPLETAPTCAVSRNDWAAIHDTLRSKSAYSNLANSSRDSYMTRSDIVTAQKNPGKVDDGPTSARSTITPRTMADPERYRGRTHEDRMTLIWDKATQEWQRSWENDSESGTLHSGRDSVGHVDEAAVVALEGDRHGGGGAVTVLGHDEVGLARPRGLLLVGVLAV
jgi:hypothetical protein